MAGCLDEPPASPRDEWIEELIVKYDFDPHKTVKYDLDPHKTKGGIPSFGSITKTVDKETWSDGDNIGELGWRMCSGMAQRWKSSTDSF